MKSDGIATRVVILKFDGNKKAADPYQAKSAEVVNQNLKQSYVNLN